jgi:multiple sugar transport system substrate-binding protein
MSRPDDERSPSPAAVGIPLLPSVSRRTLLRGSLGAAGLAAIPGLAACGGDDTSNEAGGGASTPADNKDPVTVGSNASDAVPKQAYAEVYSQFTAKEGNKVEVNTVDHNTFQEQINSYLQGKPDDVFTWFAGYRMQFFAAKDLATPISDVWDGISSRYSEALKAASTGEDGEQYFIPFYFYPWAVFYRKSVWAEKGYTAPKTLDEFKTLGAQMKKDGLTPVAFADKDGWPAMGTFDILNMRINGYDFHVSLMAGKESWEDQKVKDVFNTWRDILPIHQENPLGRTWQEAAQSVLQKKSAMYLLGMFVGQQFPEGADRDDLDFFPFPEVNSEHGQDSLDAPIDGFMLSKAPKNEAGAKKLLTYLASAEAQNTYLKSDPNNIAAANDADPSGYNALQKKAVDLIGSAKHIAQFLDRDTRPDFASTVMIPALQDFIKNPQDVDGLTKKIEQQKKTIFVD